MPVHLLAHLVLLVRVHRAIDVGQVDAELEAANTLRVPRPRVVLSAKSGVSRRTKATRVPALESVRSPPLDTALLLEKKTFDTSRRSAQQNFPSSNCQRRQIRVWESGRDYDGFRRIP